jgi:hypothetical protein
VARVSYIILTQGYLDIPVLTKGAKTFSIVIIRNIIVNEKDRISFGLERFAL